MKIICKYIPMIFHDSV